MMLFLLMKSPDILICSVMLVFWSDQFISRVEDAAIEQKEKKNEREKQEKVCLSSINPPSIGHGAECRLFFADQSALTSWPWPSLMLFFCPLKGPQGTTLS